MRIRDSDICTQTGSAAPSGLSVYWIVNHGLAPVAKDVTLASRAKSAAGDTKLAQGVSPG